MKRLKFLMVFVFLLIGTLTVLAFTKKFHKSRVVWQCLKYIGPQDYLLDYHIRQSINWESASQNPYLYCTDGFDLCAMCFDNFTTTPFEAREILYNYYRSTLSLPNHGQQIFGLNGKSVTIYRTEPE